MWVVFRAFLLHSLPFFLPSFLPSSFRSFIEPSIGLFHEVPPQKLITLVV